MRGSTPIRHSAPSLITNSNNHHHHHHPHHHPHHHHAHHHVLHTSNLVLNNNLNGINNNNNNNNNNEYMRVGEEGYEEEEEELEGEGLVVEEVVEGLVEEVVVAAGESWHALDLSNMGLRHLSPSIMHYPHITALYLSHNQLTDLPTTLFTHLPSLVFLDLSFNLFTHLPVQVGELQWLEELVLYNNKLVNLPWTIGRLARLKNLILGENPLMWPPVQIVQKGTTYIVNYLRDRMPPPPPPPERKLIPAEVVNKFNNKRPNNITTASTTTTPATATATTPAVLVPKSDDKISVFCYNILAEKYATPDRHSYTPCWALEWPYRKERILQEMLNYNADILCLQEVEAGHYRDFFQKEMTRAGYSGVFRPKSRARTMEDWDQVDGCVIFYKNALFTSAEEHLIEFQALAMARHKEFEADQEALMRIMTKDNIALAVVLKMEGKKKPLIVVNTHIHWDPQYSDVKLIQVQFMMEKLATIAGPGAPYEGAPVVICGDFNSLPGSGPYDLLTTGSAAATHVDLQDGYNYGNYSKNGFTHPFSLESAYGFMNEPPFTNYTLDFVGVLDYIFFTNKSLRVAQVLQPVDAATVKSTRLPNPYFSSDHVSLMAELQFL